MHARTHARASDPHHSAAESATDSALRIAHTTTAAALSLLPAQTVQLDYFIVGKFVFTYCARKTVHTHRASVHEAENLVAGLRR